MLRGHGRASARDDHALRRARARAWVDCNHRRSGLTTIAGAHVTRSVVKNPTRNCGAWGTLRPACAGRKIAKFARHARLL